MHDELDYDLLAERFSDAYGVDLDTDPYGAQEYDDAQEYVDALYEEAQETGDYTDLWAFLIEEMGLDWSDMDQFFGYGEDQ